MTGTLHEDTLSLLMIVSRWILLRIRNISDQMSGGNQNTHFVFRNCFSKIVPCVR